MATKKTTTKKAVKKVAAPAPAKKAVKKAPVKKAAVKKTAVKKVAAKKAVRKAAAPATTPAPLTTIVAQIDVGWGNSLYLRGEGGGLSWEKGTLMDWVDGAWSWSSTTAKSGVTFKFIINDETWATGDDLSVAAGGTSISAPSF